MVIKMLSDKSLAITEVSHFYQGERNADKITFLIPQQYEGFSLPECVCKLTYVDVNKEVHTVLLSHGEELYLDYLQYDYTVSSVFTSNVGYVSVFMSFLDEDLNVVLKTGVVGVQIEQRTDPAVDDPDSDPTTEVTLEEVAERVVVLEESQIVGMNLDGNSLSLKDKDGDQVGDPVEIETELPIILIDEEG